MIQGAIAATSISPWYVQLTMSDVDIIVIVFIFSYELPVPAADSSNCWWSFVA